MAGAEVTIPPTAFAIRLLLVFPADSFASYDLTLETGNGIRTWRRQGVQGRGVRGGSEQIAVQLPSHIFENGYYVLRVTARNDQKIEDVAAYSFQVVRR